MKSSRQLSFLNGANKLVFVGMYENSFTGLVGPSYPYWFACGVLCFFLLYCTHKNTHKQKLTNKTKIN